MAKQKKKISRNAPCPCGSGKKYKKCCLEKDEQRRREALQQQPQQQQATPKLPDLNWNPFAEKPDPEDLELFEDDPTAVRRDELWEREVDVDEDWEEEPDWGDRESGWNTEEADWEGEEDVEDNLTGWGDGKEAPWIKQVPQSAVKATEADRPVLDAWWNGFEELDGPDDMRRYIEDLFANRPELVPKIDWPDGIFDISDRYRNQGREADYIEFLMHIRREWPDSYLPDYGYFDRDILIYLVIAGRKDEVPEYLSFFREYPCRDPDNLFAIIRYLTLNEYEDILIPFVRDIAYEVCSSRKIIGGGQILSPVIMSYWKPYLRPDISDADVAELAEQMRNIKGLTNRNYVKPEFLKEQIGYIVGEFTAWDISDCETNKDVYIRYYHICQNFMGYLHRQKGKGWLMAELLRELMVEYFERVIPEGKRPKEAFGLFTKNKIDRTVVKLGKDLLFVYPGRLFGALSAVYYFAEYLGVTASISAERAQTIQGWCTELFTENYPGLVKGYPSVKAFERFPL